MKNSIKIISIILLFAFGFGIDAQAGKKPFEGIITYKISFPGADIPAEAVSMMPKVATVMVKGNMIKSTLVMGMGKQISISNGEDKTVVNLIEAMGQKFAIESTPEEIEKELSKYETTIEITEETKKIAGLECIKAIVHAKNTKTGKINDITAYYTTKYKIGEIYKGKAMFNGIPGIMMQYEIDANGMKMVFTASNIKKQKVKDEEFNIPEGYTKTTKEELQATFGG
jgi:GLPGLI family protein